MRLVRSGMVGRWVLCVAIAGAVASGIALARARPPGAVVVFPTPGTSFNPPRAQIAFRGLPASEIGPVRVIGSRSGVHSGAIKGSSDGRGGSFFAQKPFAPDETVTVSTDLNVIGGHRGVFKFRIGHPAGIGPALVKVNPATPGGVQSFQSAPDLHPPSVRVTQNQPQATPGDVFVAPQYGPLQNGPMIFNAQGQLVWFMPFTSSKGTIVTDFRVQQLHGRPVLTWWQGQDRYGNGSGVGVIYDRSYQPVALVGAGDGLAMDFHEFLLTDDGDAYITASSPVWVRGYRVPVMDSTVQEIDVKTGLVLFQWDALNHVSPHGEFPPPTTGYYDPFHINSISVKPNGNLVLSMRTTSSVYEVDRRTGKILWTLGGSKSTFHLDSGAHTAGQHDALVLKGNELSLFDNGGGPPRARQYSRGLVVRLDPKRKTVKTVRQYEHNSPLSSNFEGNVQTLAKGHAFIGWGEQPYFSEYDGAGRQIFDAHFLDMTATYRAFRSSWHAAPPLSALKAVISGARMYVSWNGATDVTGWRLLGGQSPAALTPIGTVPATGFETAIPADGRVPYYAVQALDASGRVLGTSQTVATPTG